jgi:hypothetical protein
VPSYLDASKRVLFYKIVQGKGSKNAPRKENTTKGCKKGAAKERKVEVGRGILVEGVRGVLKALRNSIINIINLSQKRRRWRTTEKDTEVF